MAHIKKHLGFAGLISTIADRINQTEDLRQDPKYSLHDILMSAFAMMFFQDPSLLSFQQRLQDSTEHNNLRSMFKVNSIPKETQMRDILDLFPTQSLDLIFHDYMCALQRNKQLNQYQFIDDYYLIAIDGSDYFSSEKIHCPGCLHKTSKKGKTRYHHQILQSVMIHPDIRQVFPLAPEPIINTDGTEKQDCEINAGKRVLVNIKKNHPKLKIIITGDGLYSKQPFVDGLIDAGMSYILVAKTDDHKILFEWVRELQSFGSGKSYEYTDEKKRIHRYQWINDVPLNGTKDASNVNFFEYQIIWKNKVTYKNSWVTDIHIARNNIVNLVKGGRARWKIENETFNTLKNQGYHIEHNFGHGKNNLSIIFFYLNVLAFYIHQILELSDRTYQQCRSKFSSRKEYWNQIRCTLRILVFRSWEHMLLYI